MGCLRLQPWKASQRLASARAGEDALATTTTRDWPSSSQVAGALPSPLSALSAIAHRCSLLSLSLSLSDRLLVDQQRKHGRAKFMKLHIDALHYLAKTSQGKTSNPNDTMCTYVFSSSDTRDGHCPFVVQRSGGEEVEITNSSSRNW